MPKADRAKRHDNGRHPNLEKAIVSSVSAGFVHVSDFNSVIKKISVNKVFPMRVVYSLSH